MTFNILQRQTTKPGHSDRFKIPSDSDRCKIPSEGVPIGSSTLARDLGGITIWTLWSNGNWYDLECWFGYTNLRLTSEFVPKHLGFLRLRLHWWSVVCAPIHSASHAICVFLFHLLKLILKTPFLLSPPQLSVSLSLLQSWRL